MSYAHFNLAAAAYREMLHDRFAPDIPTETNEQLAAIKAYPPITPNGGLRDLRIPE